MNVQTIDSDYVDELMVRFGQGDEEVRAIDADLKQKNDKIAELQAQIDALAAEIAYGQEALKNMGSNTQTVRTVICTMMANNFSKAAIEAALAVQVGQLPPDLTVEEKKVVERKKAKKDREEEVKEKVEAAPKADGDDSALVLKFITSTGKKMGELEEATGLTAAKIRTIAKALVDQGKVKIEGQKKGTRYILA